MAELIITRDMGSDGFEDAFEYEYRMRAVVMSAVCELKQEQKKQSRLEQAMTAARRRECSRFIRSTLYRVLSLTGDDERGKSVDIIGYTPDELKVHLESQFKDGMSWENRSEWHIDHIKPVSVFIKEGITDPKIINALDNLQPLFATENLRKSNKYNKVEG